MQRRLLSGTYECSLDNRFRLAIPARLREPFVAGATVGWWIDECLVVVPSVEWAVPRRADLRDDERAATTTPAR